jgi:hypothetical protein
VWAGVLLLRHLLLPRRQHRLVLLLPPRLSMRRVAA